MEKYLQCILLGILFSFCLCEAQRYPRYYYPRPPSQQGYQDQLRRLPADYYQYDDYYDDSWTSTSGLHSSRPPREPYFYDDYDYNYGGRPTLNRPNSNGRPSRPNSLSMDDMLKEADKYSGKTRSLADMVDQMHGTYEDKILPTLGDASIPDEFNLGKLSGMIRSGADMMDGASSFVKKLTSTLTKK